jgi:uncharacterized protein YndB with AHSA1/START domain
MSQPATVHNTFVIERSFAKPPATVFRAFADPALKRRWFLGGKSSDAEEFELDFRVGGMEVSRSRFKEGSPFPGVALSNQSLYCDIVPERRIVVASTMMLGDRRISATLVTFELLPTTTGTDLICTHQGAFFEGADGPQMRKGGWIKLLDGLGDVLAA